MLKNLAIALSACAAITVCTSTVSAQTAASETQQIEAIAAIVNDSPISFTDVRQRARMLLLSLGGQQPTQEQIEQITAQALDQLIDEKLQLQEAAEYEVEISDGEISGSIENLARQSGLTRELLLETLLQAGVNPTSLEEQTRADIAWRRIMGGLYGSRIRISDNQIQEQLKRMKSAAQKEQYRIAEIFLYAPTSTDKEQAITAAQSIIQQLQAGAPFELAAQRFSSAPTAATGGDMGMITLDALDDVRSGAVAALAGPGLTPPIMTDNGVYILNVIEKREPMELTSLVDLVRISIADSSEETLTEATASLETCQAAEQLAADDDNINAVSLDQVNISTLGPEGQSMVLNTPVGGVTDAFGSGSSIAVMMVCDRQDGVEDLPSAEQIEDRLYSQQLGMISERSLRNLRREATIIRN